MRSFTFVFFFLFCKGLLAQQTLFSIGYNFADVNQDPFDKTIAHFNELRPWLDEPMSEIRVVDGWALYIEKRFENNSIAMGWNFRNHETEAEGTDSNGVNQHWFIKQRYNYAYIDFFWHIIDHDRFKCGPGIGFGLGQYKILQKTEGKVIGISNPDYFDSVRETQFLSSLKWNFCFYLWEHVSFNMQPCYQIPILNNAAVDISYLEESMNFVNRGLLNEKDYEAWTTNFGFIFSLSFVVEEE
jgi:hypothetical protein